MTNLSRPIRTACLGLMILFFLTSFAYELSFSEADRAQNVVAGYWEFLSQGMPQAVRDNADFTVLENELGNYLDKSCQNAGSILAEQSLYGISPASGELSFVRTKKLADGRLLVRAMLRQGREKLRKDFILNSTASGWKICDFNNGSALGWNRAGVSQ